MSVKHVFIDIYKPVWDDETQLFYSNVDHLEKLDLITETDLDSIVENLKNYLGGDGFSILVEEFKTQTYINVLIYFNQDTQEVIKYLKTIESENVKNELNGGLIEGKDDKDEILLSVDGLFNQEDIDELLSLLRSEGIEVEIKLRKRSAFERGAGDYHEDVVLALISGAGKAIADKVMDIVLARKERRDTRFNTVNSKKIKEYLSEETGININDLGVTYIGTVDGNPNMTEIKLTSRYKNIIAYYNKETLELNYEVIHKTQTMI